MDARDSQRTNTSVKSYPSVITQREVYIYRKRHRVFSLAFLLFCVAGGSIWLRQIQESEVTSRVEMVMRQLPKNNSSSVDIIKVKNELLPQLQRLQIITPAWFLVVPALGIIGAWREHEMATLTYGLCSCCWVCGTCVGTCFLCSLLSAIITFRDAALTIVDDCEPYSCPLSSIHENATGLVNDTKAIDCLAYSAWPETYKRRFPNYGRLTDSCLPRPNLFLNCSHTGDVINTTYSDNVNSSHASATVLMLSMAVGHLLSESMPHVLQVRRLMPPDALGQCLIDKDMYDSYSMQSELVNKAMYEARGMTILGLFVDMSLLVILFLATVAGFQYAKELSIRPRT